MWQKGDIIECIENNIKNKGLLTFGKQYICETDEYDKGNKNITFVKIKCDNNIIYDFYTTRFKLITQKQIDYLQIARDVCGGY